MARRYPLGMDYPSEGFVQRAIESYFLGLGYDLLQEGHTDLACVHRDTGDRWVIEAKGHTASVGVDFNTCMGQLLKRMSESETARFGLALPDTPPYHRQLRQISSRVRQALNLHWLLVGSDASVTVVLPEQALVDAGAAGNLNAEDFEAELLRLFTETTSQGLPYLDVVSGELHRRLGRYPGSDHRMPTCCEVMWRLKSDRDQVLQEPPKGKGATLKIRYTLPR